MQVMEFVQQYWTYLTIPLVSAMVGYATNWLAVKMMMHPLEFKGVGSIGWQGVVPANARKMARITVDHSLKRVLTQDELLERIDADQLIAAGSARLEPALQKIVDAVMTETSNYGLPVSNFLWSASPIQLKQSVYNQVRKKMPETLHRAIDDLKVNLDELMDVNELIVEKLGNNKHLVVEVFEKAAGQEFKFIERSGFYFGLPLGIPVMFLWYLFPVWWLLPLFGALVGYITNSLALYLVQKPLNPVKVGGFVIQGLFIKRQKEVCRYYGKLFAQDLVTAEVIVAELLKVENSVQRIRELIHHEVNYAIEESQGIFKPLAVMSMGPTEYTKISHIISEHALQELHHPDKRAMQYLNEAFDIENTIAERMGNLPPEEYFELLHPVIEQDEWKLIAIGAVLGLFAGYCQWLLLT